MARPPRRRLWQAGKGIKKKYASRSFRSFSTHVGPQRQVSGLPSFTDVPCLVRSPVPRLRQRHPRLGSALTVVAAPPVRLNRRSRRNPLVSRALCQQLRQLGEVCRHAAGLVWAANVASLSLRARIRPVCDLPIGHKHHGGVSVAVAVALGRLKSVARTRPPSDTRGSAAYHWQGASA